MTTVVNKNPPNVYIFTDLYRYLPLERGGEEHDEDDHNEGHIATQNQQKVGVILRGHPGWAALHTRRNKQSINPAVAHPEDGFSYPVSHVYHPHLKTSCLCWTNILHPINISNTPAQYTQEMAFRLGRTKAMQKSILQ